MTTLGPARRAVVGAVAACCMTGLAACGHAVAGAGTAASGSVKQGAAGASRSTAHPLPSGVNPGGVMIPASVRAHVSLCRSIPRLTRLTFALSTKPPNLHVREVLPAGFTIRDATTVRQLATLLCALPPMPAGRMMCPNDIGATYRLFFAAPGRSFGEVLVGMSGCRVVNGLGPARDWAGATALQQALAQRFGIHFPGPMP